MWTHGSGEPGLRLFVGACVVAVAACGDEGGTSNGGACEAGQPEVSAASTAPVQGSIRLQDRLVVQLVDGVPNDQAQTLVSGGFQRIITTSTPASLTLLGTQCVGLNSVPVAGEFERLDAGPVRVVAGANDETISPMENIYRLIVPGDRWLDEADQVSVTGGGAGSEFPGFDVAVDAPDTFRLDSPATDGSARLRAGDTIDFRWAPGNGDLVLVDISPQPALPSGGKVQCFFEDRGCGVVPASATIFLRSNDVTNFQVVASRITDARAQLDDETTMDVSLSSTVQFELPPEDAQ